MVRPTPAEQLTGAARILEDLVLPEVQGRYAAEPLRSVITALQNLARRWDTTIADLVEENGDCASVVAPALAPYRDRLPDLAALVAESSPEASPGPADRAPTFSAVHDLNTRWRALLAEAVPLVQADPAAHAVVRDHLRRYIDRHS
jgi:hypothetical protein